MTGIYLFNYIYNGPIHPFNSGDDFILKNRFPGLAAYLFGFVLKLINCFQW